MLFRSCSYTDKVKDICDTTVLTSRFVREYLETIEQAPDFEVEGLKSKYVPSQQKWTQKSLKKRNESQYFLGLRKLAAFIPRFT